MLVLTDSLSGLGDTRKHLQKAYKDALNVTGCGLCLVHEHFLGNLFAPLCPVQFVICVAIQGGPAEELGQSLHTQTNAKGAS